MSRCPSCRRNHFQKAVTKDRYLCLRCAYSEPVLFQTIWGKLIALVIIVWVALALVKGFGVLFAFVLKTALGL